MANGEFIGITLDLIGKIMIAYTAIRVHFRVWQEHKIDRRVFREMRHEQVMGIWGIVFMILGYLLRFPHYW